LLSDIERYDKARAGWLLDTNILSAAMGSRRIPRGVEQLLKKIPDERMYLSALTLGEIMKGIATLDPENEKRQILIGKLTSLESNWSDRILNVDTEIAKQWGYFQAYYQSRGKPVPVIDSLIAATACVHNLVVVSHDKAFALMHEHIVYYDPLAP